MRVEPTGERAHVPMYVVWGTADGLLLSAPASVWTRSTSFARNPHRGGALSGFSLVAGECRVGGIRLLALSREI